TPADAAAAAPREATGNTQPGGRSGFTASQQAIATIPGIPEARFWGDSEADYLRILGGIGGDWLALSAGGEDSGFGAGLLTGLSQSGRRPDYTVVTGVSSGALLAPFVFLGSSRDAEMRDNFMALNAAEVFEDHRTPESLLDTWPLRDFIKKRITPELIAAVAAEHKRGRRLIVLTANLDAARPVAWNMGAIAAAGTEASAKLFRDVLVASSAIPGLFPPMMIESETGGQRLQEMHVDGGLAATIYAAPDTMLLATSTQRLPMSTLTIIVNGKLMSEFSVTDRSLVAVLGRSLSVGVKRGSRSTAVLASGAARRSGIPFNLAFVDQSFNYPSRGMFDAAYMKALFESGLAQGKSAAPFVSAVPGTPGAEDAPQAQGKPVEGRTTEGSAAAGGSSAQ
ncbi:patatin-like phospholipase family protein, partial [Rhodoplanes roseus]